MKIKIGNATFETSPVRSVLYLAAEHSLQVAAGTPTVLNRWNCTPPGTPDPNPPTLTLGAYVRLIPHAAEPLPPGDVIPPTPTWRAETVYRASGELLQGFLNLTGFANQAVLGAWLQKELGEKKGLKIPFDALIKPHKDRYSLQVSSVVEYDLFTLDHPRLPILKERSVLLLLPVRLKHEVRKTDECTEDGKTSIPFWSAVAPDTIETVRIPSVTEAERRLRKSETKRKQGDVRRQIDSLEAQKRQLEEAMRKLREEMKALDEDGKD